MIYDRIENLYKYVSEDDFSKIRKFLELVSVDMEERKYEIDGDRIFAKVESYPTKDVKDCRIEAHDRYIDIQCGISGAEGVGVYKRAELTTVDDYNPEKDVVHFDMNTAVQTAFTTNSAGYFTMLYPEEAHSPKQKVKGYDMVKKFVIKYEIKK